MTKRYASGSLVREFEVQQGGTTVRQRFSALSDGLIGVIPVFETREQAEAFQGVDGGPIEEIDVQELADESDSQPGGD